MDATGVVAAISGAAVGALGILVGARTASAERARSERVSRETRLYASPEAVYRELYRILFRWLKHLDGVKSAGGDPSPQLLPWDEYVDLWALVSLLGTEDIAEAFEACERAWKNYREAQERGGADERVMRAAREAITNLMRLVRTEVSRGPATTI
jgi:hypothetical protein